MCKRLTRAPFKTSNGRPSFLGLPPALAEALKDKKWQDFAHAQGGIFVAFAVEAGGATGEAALPLINMAACANGASTAEIAAFTTSALQRTHITTQL